MGRRSKGTQLKADEKTGVFYIHWSENGRSKRRSTGTTDRAAAERVMAGFLLEVGSESYPTGDLPIVALLDDYWDEHACKLPSAEQAEIAIRHLKAHAGHAPLSAINRAWVDRYRRARNSGTIGKPSIDNTVRRELGAVLIPALNHAAREKRIARTDIPFIVLPPQSAPRDRWLTPEEADRLREACQWVTTQGKDGRYTAVRVDEPTRVRVFVEIALGIAARRGAIENLLKVQVDLDRCLIYLNPKGRLQTKKRRPTVPIPEKLFNYVEYALEDFKGEYILGHNGSIRSAFETACERAELDGVTPHTLRHTWATWAAQRGVSMFEIASVMGDTLATVEKNYLHHAPEFLRKAVNY